jgi:NADH dehydrogenase/NADH:ubiquinone oxidoreductase subunit G
MVVDHQRTAIMDKAHLVLSAASFAESDGTVVNNEGRAQRFFQVYDPAYYDAHRDAGKLALAALPAQHRTTVKWTGRSWTTLSTPG